MTKNFAKLCVGGFFGFAAVAASFYFFNQKNQTAATSPSVARTVAQDPGYCLAIRGNGELQPAHWGAMARTTEQLGLPSAMAGGSSATITMMIMESMAAHPMVANKTAQLQKQRVSLLWKSVHGFFGELRKTEDWQNLVELYGQYIEAKKASNLTDLSTQINANQLEKARELVARAIELGWLDVQASTPLLKALQSGDAKRAQFYVQQLRETAAVFGKFNAETDDNLFFRAGLVSFENVARSFGKIAGFYSATGESKENMENWKDFFEICGPQSEGKSWLDIVKEKPQCQESMHTLFTQSTAKKAGFESRTIGKVIPVFPITAVLTGSAADEYRAAQIKYHQKLDVKFGKKFRLSNPEDIRFGYWGDPQRLEGMKAQLSQNPNDEKSRRFLALGETSWQQVLSLSPAEPGLSPLKEFETSSGEKLISAGGWPDLAPITALKAAGCENVVFLTRQSGESIFGQGVAKRLLNLDRDWKLLKSGDANVTKLNNEGDPSDMNSLWSRIYNLGNPQSSIRLSLAQANAILCTNWNAFDVTKEFGPLIEDSYRSSFWINPQLNSSFVGHLQPVLQENLPGCTSR